MRNELQAQHADEIVRLQCGPHRLDAGTPPRPDPPSRRGSASMWPASTRCGNMASSRRVDREEIKLQCGPHRLDAGTGALSGVAPEADVLQCGPHRLDAGTQLRREKRKRLIAASMWPASTRCGNNLARVDPGRHRRAASMWPASTRCGNGKTRSPPGGSTPTLQCGPHRLDAGTSATPDSRPTRYQLQCGPHRLDAGTGAGQCLPPKIQLGFNVARID